MELYHYREYFRGYQAGTWNFEPSANGPGRPGIRFTSPGNAGGWLPLDVVDEWAVTLKAAALASTAQYTNRATGWAA